MVLENKSSKLQWWNTRKSNSSGFHGPAWLWLGGSPPRDYLPGFETSKFQSTCLGARPRPAVAAWCRGEPPACPAVEKAIRDPPREEKSKSIPKYANSVRARTIRWLRARRAGMLRKVMAGSDGWYSFLLCQYRITILLVGSTSRTKYRSIPGLRSAISS